MPVRFSISERGRGADLEHNLINLSYRLFDLKPLADRAQVVMERQNADGALMGVDQHGETYEALAKSTWKRRPGSGPPLAPRGAASRIVALFRVRQEASFDAITVIGSWPNVPWIKYHVTGTARMPIRDPAGIRPHGWQQLAVEFHDWVQEVLRGGPGSGPSVAPGTGGGGGPYPVTPPASSAPVASPASSAPAASPI